MVRVRVEFDKVLREWDGFGINYVETSQTRDYATYAQDYGGYSTLCEESRQTIQEMVFGADGLMPGVVKMFLDPFHQKAPGDRTETIIASDYDHTTTTKWQRTFVRDGLARTRSRGGDLQVIATLYSPPAFMTKQNVVRGRDLDPAFAPDCAKYIAAYAKYLRDEEHLPVRFVSVHNEGECWERWPPDGTDDEKRQGDDYNMLWTPEQIAAFMPLVRSVLEKNGMADAGVAPGETTHWTRFHTWGIADAIADDPASVGALGLITSHGFWCPSQDRWAGDWRSAGIDIVRGKRPGLHAWTTSTSWGSMDVGFLWEFYHQIYSVKVNAIIPWAFIQNHSLWAGGDPNPGCAFVVDGTGGYIVQPGYYYYKQMCRAGQPGMGVARTRTNDTEIAPVAFCRNGTQNPDAFVILSTGEQNRGVKDVAVGVTGSAHKQFRAYRTSATQQWKDLGVFAVNDGTVRCEMPPRSVTSFFGV